MTPSRSRFPVEQVRPGDVMLVRPGDQIPVDGVIVAGDGRGR